MAMRRSAWVSLLLLAGCPGSNPSAGPDAGPIASNDAGTQEVQVGEGLRCDPDGEEDVCAPHQLSCTQVLSGDHERWACARQGSSIVPIAAVTRATYRPPGQGAQEESQLALRLEGSDQIVTGAQISIVHPPKGTLVIRGDGVFYTPDDQPESVTSPFEDGPAAGIIAYYDSFRFRIGTSQEILGVIELRPPDARGGHAGNASHPWEVTVDTGLLGATLGVHSSVNGSITARRIWPECWTVKEVVYPMSCGGGQTAVGIGLSLGLSFEVDRARLLLLGDSTDLAGGCSNVLWSIKNVGGTLTVVSVNICFVSVIPKHGDGFSAWGYCGSIGGLGIALGGGGISCFGNPLHPLHLGDCYDIEGLSEEFSYACGPPDPDATNCLTDCDCGAFGSDIFCSIIGPEGGVCSPCVAIACNLCSDP